MTITQEEFSARFKGSPIKGSERRSPKAVPSLAIALNDEEPLIRGHAAWALDRIGTEGRALRGRVEMEENAWAREEVAAARPWVTCGPGSVERISGETQNQNAGLRLLFRLRAAAIQLAS